ncbi:MAG: alpha/beta fold hydrolase [Reinekea sp.]
MKSSSQLFPVELVSAEICNGAYQDLYSLKPNRCQDKTVEIALLHLHKTPRVEDAQQILFVHSIFQSHWQWMDGGPYQQMVSKLVEQGYSVWLMDWRAHGSSKMNRDYRRNRLQIMAEHDLLAVTEFIQERSTVACTIVACGYGAQMVQRVIPALQHIQQFIFIDAETLVTSRKYWIPGYRLLKYFRLLGKTWVNGVGSEAESVELFREILLECGWLGRRNQAVRQQAKTELLQQADNILWLCSSRQHERRAQKALRRQAATRQLSVEQLPVAIFESVSS